MSFQNRSRRARLIAGLFLTLLAVFVFASYRAEGVVFDLLAVDPANQSKIERVQERLSRYGAFAPFVYVLLVTVEVVLVPLPGVLFYAPGGVIFGGFRGGLYALIGNVLGAGIAFQIARAFGGESYLRNKPHLTKYVDAVAGRGFWVVFLLRVNPVTSSDLVSYAAGLTPMRRFPLLAGTALGMAPLCFSQAYLSMSLMTRFPWLIYPLLAACLAYAAWAVALVAKTHG